MDLLPSGDPNAAIFLAVGTTSGELSCTLDTLPLPNREQLLRLRVVRTDSNYGEYGSKFTIAKQCAIMSGTPSWVGKAGRCADR